MGEAVTSDHYTPQQRTRYRQYLAEDLEIFDHHLQESEFDDQGTIGLELELNVVDENMDPAFSGPDILAALDSEYQTEIGTFNLELNHPPLAVTGSGLRDLERGITERLERVRQAANRYGARPVMIGTLPTLRTDHLEDPACIVPENRYRGLSNAVLASRGEMVSIDVAGTEHYRHDFATIAPEATCTSAQLHLQVSPERFAAAWNAAQAIAGVQVALSANSPLFLGYDAWRENRIPVFRQSIDTRTSELVTQGVRPRVWFGERWITSVFDLFEENVRYFSPLLPESREFSGTPVMQGKTPALHYLTLHNGTVWRWNRPIYAPGNHVAHLRLENRLLAAAPTPTDLIADAAFYYGVLHYLMSQTRPVWSRLTFETARENFFAAAEHGIHSRLKWPRLGSTDATALITEGLLRPAREGLSSLEVDNDVIDYYLSIVAERAHTRCNGAEWQLRTLRALGGTRVAPDSPLRRAALAEMLRRYLAHQESGQPVHTWPVES